jgi:PKD repeat protein
MKRNVWRWALVALIALGTTAEAASLSATWTKRTPTLTPAGQPGARGWVDMLYDPVEQRTVLFGGSGSFYFNDVLALSIPLNQWTQKEPSFWSVAAIKPPCARDEYAFEYDAYNDLYWIFGGSGYDCHTTISSSAQGGTTTTVLVDTTLPSTASGFYNDWIVQVSGTITYNAYVASYDAPSKKLTLRTAIPVLAPGKAYQLRPQNGGGTWSYDPATRAWRGFDAPSFGYTGSKPGSRLSPAFAYSSRDTALVMFGGSGLNDTWALDAQTQTWVRMTVNGSTASPAPRAQITNSMVYDGANDLFVLFGGRCGDAGTRCTYNAALGDTWIYRLSTNTWTRMLPAQSPPAREQHQMAYDPLHGVTVLFGGHNGATYYNDVWVYDAAANTWTQVPTPAVNPGGRYLGAFVYDPGIGEFVLYAGNGPGAVTQSSVWTLRLTNATGNQNPVARISVSPASGTTATTFSFSGATSTDDGSIVSYAWDFGDGATATGVSASHQYAATGNYTARLTVTDNQGATGSTTVPVSVTLPTPTISVSGLTLSGTTANGTVTQVTVNGSPVSFSTGPNGAWSVSLGVSSSGTLTIGITASGSGGSVTRNVTVNVP